MSIENKYLERPQIRVFVSSTFKDLQEERDILKKKTFPKLQEVALKHAVSITEIDLRWGITENESKMGKVLQVCLEEVDKSIPFFIGIIGKKYGWIPTFKDIDKQILKDTPQVKTYIEEGLSITEIEFLYGALENKEKMNALFFIPKGSLVKENNSEESKKLRLLIDKVINNGKYPIYYYNTPNDISERVEKFFLNFLDEKYPIPKESPKEMVLLSQYLHAKYLTANLIECDDYNQSIDCWLKSDSSVLLLLGESGIGKSSILAKWIIDNINADYIVIPQFIGHGENQDSGESSMRFLVEILSKYVCLTDKSIKDLSLDRQLQYLINHFSSEKQCVIIIDGLNQILANEKEKFLNWILKSNNTKIKILISSIPDDISAQILIANKVRTLPIYGLKDDKKLNFIFKYLAHKGKKIEETLVPLILKSKIFNNTLSLKILLDTLDTFSSYESIKLDVNKYTECKSSCEFYCMVLNVYDEEFGFLLLQKICSYIYVSRKGLYLDEIISLCNITPLKWAQIYRMLKVNLSEENGRISFIHHKFKNAIYLHYLRSDSVGILDYKKSLISLLELKNNIRTRDELPYYYNELCNYKSLYNYLMQIDVATYFLENDSVSFALFWKNLSNYKSTYSIADYLSIEYIDADNGLTVMDFLCLVMIKK